MVERRKPIPVREAVSRVMAHVTALGQETVPISDSYGRILAEAIVARHDVPLCHRSAYDGFAIRSEDSTRAAEHNRILFHFMEHLGAGDLASRELHRGEAVRIMTGAAMPRQADAVVMLEQAQTSERGDSFTIRRPYAHMENVSLQGEDAKTGEVLVEQGTVIHPGTVALLATFGYAKVRVAAKPVVGVISTGSELLEAEEPLRPGKIRNSNGPMVAAQLARMGIPSRSYGKVKDDIPSCCEAVQRAIEETDCVVTTGGVSVGDYDYLPEIYERLGAKVLFNKVAMRPGSVTTVAVRNKTFLFGLSGNPSACFTGFELLVRPALLSMMGCAKPYLPYTEAVLLEDFRKEDSFRHFVRAIYRYNGAQATIEPAGSHKSNAVRSIARGNAFMILPGEANHFRKGAKVGVLLLGMEEGEGEMRL